VTLASSAPASAVPHSTTGDVVARIERLPTSWWHVKARIIIGTATFFDAFDALAIASVLPAIAPLWKLSPQQIGFLISAGFVGQLIGALLFGWVSERFGRMTAMIWSIAIFAVMSLVCAFAWDYGSLVLFRTIQGIGLGGEVPVAATYISEITRAKGRGRFVLLYELVFPVGLVGASLAGLWIVPRFGWQYMFVLGAVPAILALVLRRLLPESPRWLAVRGRSAEAEAAVATIERETERATGNPLPPPQPVIATHATAASWADLFGPFYLRRTLVVWLIWFTAYLVNYGIAVWLPTLYRTVFRLPLDVSLQYGLITQAVGLVGTVVCALTIDRVGRRPWFAIAFFAAAAALIGLWTHGADAAERVLG
jgi:MFS transporter, putative metabolite:H+ symporter